MATITQIETGLTKQKVAGITATAPLGGSVAAGEINATIHRQLFPTVRNPVGTGADSVLASFALPAEYFDQAGRGIRITAIGDFGANAQLKLIKLIYNPSTAVVGTAPGSGGDTIVNTGDVATNGSIFIVNASVYKIGAAGSNTQRYVGGHIQVGAAVLAPQASSASGAIEHAPILIAVTGDAATAVTDIGLRLFEIQAIN